LSALSLKHRWILCLAALLGALLFGGAALAGGVQLPAPVDDDDQTDQLIIKYRAGSAARDRPDVQTMADAHDRLRRAGLQMRRLRGNALGANVMKLDRRLKPPALAALARLIAAHPDVEYAEPDRRMHILATPNDPGYSAQWHYSEAAGGINAPAAWDLSTGSGVVVAVIDTGYRPHVDLEPNRVAGYDMIGLDRDTNDAFVANDGGGRDADPLDPGDGVAAGECYVGSSAANSSWHGTHVAGTIAAVTNNASGVAGVAYGARFQPVRSLGRCGGYTSDIADAISWASGGTVNDVPPNANPARVINLSLGGGGACAITTQSAINGARSRGAVVVVAAGNSNANVATSSPANCQGVIAVAAVGRTGGKASYSNYGAGITLAAPGGGGGANGVLSTWNVGTTTPGADAYAYASGTSMATPHVSAVAALMFSANPGLKPSQVERLLKSSARAFPATCSPCGAGIVDAGAAVSSAIAALHPSIVSSANPSVAGGLVTFTVTVTGDSPGGTVQFMDGSSTLGSPVALSAATLSTSTASHNVSSLTVGSHGITAVYSGDANNAGVTSTALTQTVAAAASTTSLSLSAASLTQGQGVTLTASVSGYAPTGSVQFKDGDTDLGNAVTLTDGAASYSTNALAAGSHSVTAAYLGDANNASSTSAAAILSVTLPAGAGVGGGVEVGGANSADIPTLPQWGLILLGCVLVGLAQRRRPQKARRA
jgi:serine protease